MYSMKITIIPPLAYLTSFFWQEEFYLYIILIHSNLCVLSLLTNNKILPSFSWIFVIILKSLSNLPDTNFTDITKLTAPDSNSSIQKYYFQWKNKLRAYWHHEWTHLIFYHHPRRWSPSLLIDLQTGGSPDLYFAHALLRILPCKHIERTEVPASHQWISSAHKTISISVCGACRLARNSKVVGCG